MRTGDLIRAMAADTAPRRPVGPVLAATMAGLALVVGAIALAVLGPNPELGAMMTGPLMLLRQAFPLLLALGAALLALRLASPGAGSGPTRLMLVAAAALAAGVVLRELALVPVGDWGRAAMGGTARACLLSVSLIALPLLGGALRALARGAPIRLRATGALAGLLAGAIAAAIYALHCTEPSPLFYAAWYGLALLGVTLLGAALGPRVLRW
jgi:hypothetical protein